MTVKYLFKRYSRYDAISYSSLFRSLLHFFFPFQVHRLVIVDDHEVVKGIVSLSDILQALVLTGGDNGKRALIPRALKCISVLSCHVQSFLQCRLLIQKHRFPDSECSWTHWATHLNLSSREREREVAAERWEPARQKRRLHTMESTNLSL